MKSMITRLWNKYKDLVLYAVFGALTTLVNWAVYTLCYSVWGIGNVPANIAAWVASVTFAFFTNKAFVFHSKSWQWDVVVPEALRFYGGRAGTGVLDLALMYLTVDVLGWNATWMKLLVNVIVIILNYVFSRWLVFARKDGQNSGEAGQKRPPSPDESKGE